MRGSNIKIFVYRGFVEYRCKFVMEQINTNATKTRGGARVKGLGGGGQKILHLLFLLTSHITGIVKITKR